MLVNEQPGQPRASAPLAIAMSIVVALCGTMAVSHAEDAPGMSEAVPNATSIPDDKLDAVANALVQVTTLKQKYRQQIEEADALEEQKLAEEAAEEMEKAVTDQGLSVGEYASILVVAQNDPEFREKIMRRVDPAYDE